MREQGCCFRGATLYIPSRLDGEAIAFFGTNGGLTEANHPLAFLTRGRDFLLAPWDLYLASAALTQAEIFQSNIQLAGNLRWSPQGDRLLFTGLFRGHPGIWLVSLADRRLVRLWADTANLSWSPDGTQVVFLQRVPGPGNSVNSFPSILSLDQLPATPP